MSLGVFPLFDWFYAMPILASFVTLAAGSSFLLAFLFILEKLRLLMPVEHHYGVKNAKYPEEDDGEVIFPFLHSHFGAKEWVPLKFGLILSVLALVLALYVRG